MFHSYTVLVTLHVVLFAYWLGGDFGVYVCSRYIVRPDLPLNERERFLEALMAIDIMPRTAIVLLPVVGLQLAVLPGAPMPGGPMQMSGPPQVNMPGGGGVPSVPGPLQAPPEGA